EAVFHPGRARRVVRRRRRTAALDAGDAAGGRRARREGAVMDRELEIHRAALTARVDEPRLAVVVGAQAPLAAVGPGGLALEAARRPADAERVVGRVDPVVEVPHQARLLVLDVRVAALADAGEDHLALVGDAVAVGVGQLD